MFDKLRNGDHWSVTRLDRGWATPADVLQDIDTFADLGVGIHAVNPNLSWTSDDGSVTETNRALVDFQRTSGGSRRKEAFAKRKRPGFRGKIECLQPGVWPQERPFHRLRDTA